MIQQCNIYPSGRQLTPTLNGIASIPYINLVGEGLKKRTAIYFFDRADNIVPMKQRKAILDLHYRRVGISEKRYQELRVSYLRNQFYRLKCLFSAILDELSTYTLDATG